MASSPVVRPTVCVDWDGTCVEYRGWAEYEPGVHGDWLPEAVEALRMIARCCDLVILTARPDADWPEIVRRLAVQDIVARVTDRKPAALAYIDDRAIHYWRREGWGGPLEQLGARLRNGVDGWARVDLCAEEPAMRAEEVGCG